MQQVAVLFTGITSRLPLHLGHFLKGEGKTQKKQNVILLQLSRVIKIPKGVRVYAASFWRKIWTKHRWYFLLVALYYCMISKVGTTSKSSKKYVSRQALKCWHGMAGRANSFLYQSKKIHHVNIAPGPN